MSLPPPFLACKNQGVSSLSHFLKLHFCLRLKFLLSDQCLGAVLPLIPQGYSYCPLSSGHLGFLANHCLWTPVAFPFSQCKYGVQMSRWAPLPVLQVPSFNFNTKLFPPTNNCEDAILSYSNISSFHTV